MTRDILASIATYKRAHVAERRRSRSMADLERDIAGRSAPRGFARALSQPRSGAHLALIAEIKRASPSRGLIRPDFEPASLALAYEAGGASCLSILTDGPSFSGADADLCAARGASALPCLRKDFLVDPWQVAESRALGADAILVILAMVDDSLASELMAESTRLGMDTLVETHDQGELARATQLGATLVGINNRDLHTFATDLSTTEALAPLAPPSACIVTESGISTAADAARMALAGAHAMLVGESLMRQADVERATRRLLG